VQDRCRVIAADSGAAPKLLIFKSHRRLDHISPMKRCFDKRKIHGADTFWHFTTFGV